MSGFAGKVVLITGAAGGIGQVLCAHFAELGATLIALDKNAAVAELRDALRARGVPVECAIADISVSAEVGAAIAEATARIGAVDVLINNAAIAEAGTLAATTAAGWRREIEVNLDGAYHCVEAVALTMKERRAGVIVNIGSVNGLTALGNPAYSAAKAALISYTRALAVEYGRYGIRANIVCPGTVQTPAWRARAAQNPQIFAELRKWYPLGRIVEPIDVAKAAAFLACDDARLISGAVLTVDAGLMAGNAVMARELTLEDP